MTSLMRVTTGKMLQILCLCVILHLAAPATISQQDCDKATKEPDAKQVNKGFQSFGIRLFSELTTGSPKKNIAFSPFSIQTCIAMARMGAEGKTATDIDQGLALADQNPEELAENYHAILAQYENSSMLTIANKMYIMQGYEVQSTFRKALTKFFSSVEAVNFDHNRAAAQTINAWVNNKTNHLIKDLIKPSMLDANTRLVLLNAIHFKGEWVHQFPEENTRKMDFYMDTTNTVKVQMMHITNSFNYGEFPELNATALEMPYKDSDLSMLIVLPNSRTGLTDVEEKFKNVTLPFLTERMFSKKVAVRMPKFKVEFEMELSASLKNLGMSRMFSDVAEFGKMLKTTEQIQVSKVMHKAFIEVNEKGTEAAAATGTSFFYRMPGYKKPKYFKVNKPFIYFIKNSQNVVIFMGNVSKFKQIK